MRHILLLAAALALSGCGALGIGGREAPTTVDRVARERTVDPARAAALINGYRAARGKVVLAVDPELNRIAAETAATMARRDRLATRMHTVGGLQRRLAGRFPDAAAAENIGAGAPTLAMIVDKWKASPEHDHNILNGDLTHMGIGLALTDKGVFHSYWVLILARPRASEPAAADGPFAVPGPALPAPAGGEPAPMAAGPFAIPGPAVPAASAAEPAPMALITP